MKLYLIFFLFSFVSTQSYDKFIKVAVGPVDNYVVGTHDTKYLNCNKIKYCEIGNHEVLSVCVKEQCQILQQGRITFKRECYVGNYMDSTEFIIISKYKQCFDFVSLNSSRKKFTASCYQRFYQAFQMTMHKNGWILYKVSNNSKDDFREFFSDDPPSTSPPSREESDGTTTIEDSSSATKEPDDTTTTEDSSSVTKDSDDTTTIEDTSSVTKEPDDTTTTEDCSFVIKVALILSAVVILLLIIFLVTYCFYRKNLPKPKKTENSNGILLRKNGMFNQISSGRESDNPLYSSLYGINQLKERSQPKTPRSPSQTNKPAQNCEDVFYANITKQEDGGSVTAGGQSHVVVNRDLYATVNKDESYYENSARLDNLAQE